MRTEIRYRVRLLNHRDKIFDLQIEECDFEKDTAPRVYTVEELSGCTESLLGETILAVRKIKEVRFTGYHQGYDNAFKTEKDALDWAAELGWTRVKE